MWIGLNNNIMKTTFPRSFQFPCVLSESPIEYLVPYTSIACPPSWDAAAAGAMAIPATIGRPAHTDRATPAVATTFDIQLAQSVFQDNCSGVLRKFL